MTEKLMNSYEEASNASSGNTIFSSVCPLQAMKLSNML